MLITDSWGEIEIDLAWSWALWVLLEPIRQRGLRGARQEAH